MADSIKLIECPRDAWQGLPGRIPTAIKVEYLKALIAAGFKHIDAVSFVSPKAVPQMADSENVLTELDPPDDVEIIAIVVNERGVERAIATEAVRTVGFPYSLSPTFLKNNQNQTLEENLDTLEKVKQKADESGLDTIAYVSMAFGNPYGDLWNVDELIEGVGILADMDLQAISLADTVGLATRQQIADVLGPVLTRYDGVEIGVHLHSRPDDASPKVLASYDVGCRRFDSAIGGLGGCPFAQDVLVGNIPTETLLAALRSRGVELPLRKSISDVVRMSAEIGERFNGPKM
jgi:hydroxymethylglutaryl-CoA lyase